MLPYSGKFVLRRLSRLLYSSPRHFHFLSREREGANVITTKCVPLFLLKGAPLLDISINWSGQSAPLKVKKKHNNLWNRGAYSSIAKTQLMKMLVM